MPRYTIDTHHNGHQWVATFDDYDGAPDSLNRSVMGKADDEVDAIMDLLTEDWAEQHQEPKLPCQLCGKRFDEHLRSRPEGVPVPRVPCLGLKSGFSEKASPVGVDLVMAANTPRGR